MGKITHRRFTAIQEFFSEISASAQENFSGARLVRAFAREATEERRFDAKNREFRRRNLGLARLNALYFPMLQALVGTGFAAVLWVGGRKILAGELTVPAVRRVQPLPHGARLARDRPRLGREPLAARLGLLEPDGRPLGRRAPPRGERRGAAPGGTARGRGPDVRLRRRAARPPGRLASPPSPGRRSPSSAGPGSGKSTLLNLLLRL